jgi:hypothetical protein
LGSYPVCIRAKRKLIDIGFYSTLFKGFGIQLFSGRFSGCFGRLRRSFLINQLQNKNTNQLSTVQERFSPFFLLCFLRRGTVNMLNMDGKYTIFRFGASTK